MQQMGKVRTASIRRCVFNSRKISIEALQRAGFILFSVILSELIAADEGLLLLTEQIEPTMRDVYGAAWFLEVPFNFALWILGAEILVRFLGTFSDRDRAVMAGSAAAGYLIGGAGSPGGRSSQRGDAASSAFGALVVFGVVLLAQALLSKRWVSYPLAVILFMGAYSNAAERTGHEMAVEAARSNPDTILPIDKVSLVTRPAMIPSPELSGLQVALRVNNGTAHDLVQVTAQCTFYLRNGEVAHRNDLVFPFEYRIPPGFGARVKARDSARREFDAVDYSDRVTCELLSGHLKPVELSSAGGSNLLTLLEINESKKTIRIRNDSELGIALTGVKCVGLAQGGNIRSSWPLGHNHMGWVRYSSFRREFRRDGEPLIRPGTEEVLEFTYRFEDYSGGSAVSLTTVKSPFVCEFKY